MKFIDLFAGIGGFHIALEQLGHECVFASELKESLSELYSENFNIDVHRNIRRVDIKDIPEHEILCAGFPCQPFSKAGSQNGLDDKKNGSLFDVIVDILDYHKPHYFILENVRNLFTHNKNETWNYIKDKLVNKLGYTVDTEIYSPHHFGIPQHRERLFIVGSLTNLDHFKWAKKSSSKTSVNQVLDSNPKNVRNLEPEKIKVLEIWQEFFDALPKNEKLPGFPIWSMEFGADYPFEDSTPHTSSSWKLARHKGSFGEPLKGKSYDEKMNNLPSYAKTPQEEFPSWKKNYIRKNREFYEKHKKALKPIVKKIRDLGIPSWQKFEWNIQGGERTIKNYIIQFRGSGVRIKRTDFFPSLVTVSTQIPIIGWENRYITPKEGARLQSLGDIKLPENIGGCFSALGNAVNVEIVKAIAKELVVPLEHQQIEQLADVDQEAKVKYEKVG